jgi:glycine C-acetyltransferase
MQDQASICRETSLSDYLMSTSEDLFSKTADFSRFLLDGRARGYEVYLRAVTEYQGGKALVEKSGGGVHQVVVMCSSDYLGLARHPEVIAAAIEALHLFGTNVASVPLIAGSTSAHKILQREIADFVGTQTSVLFPTGHAANLGVIQALCSHRDMVILDKLCHYSIIDGIRLSYAKWRSFRHNDTGHLEQVLARARENESVKGILIVVEGVYGIDGDVTPLSEICAVARKYGARVMIDDAHATGVIGARGKGTAEFCNVKKPPDILMGSLSKAIGSTGGWIACSSEVADYLRYYARTVVFSVGLQTPSVMAASAALHLIRGREKLLETLWTNIEYFRMGLENMGVANAARSRSAIMSAIIGDEALLRDLLKDVFEKGLWVEGLPFPAVPRGQERLRFRVSGAHTKEDLDCALNILEDSLGAHGLLTKAGKHKNVPDNEETGKSSSRQQQLQHIAHLAVEGARERLLPLPWEQEEAYEHVLDCAPPWDFLGKTQPFLVLKHGLPVACCVAMVGKGGEDGSGTGYIGHVHWRLHAEAELHSVLQAAHDYLVGCGVARIVSPCNMPLQVFGGGVMAGDLQGSLPMLQPIVPQECADVLTKMGYAPSLDISFSRINLRKALAAMAQMPEHKITVRNIIKSRFEQEMQGIHGLLNATISRLPECVSVPYEALKKSSADLRDLILPDLWLIAECSGKMFGFVGAFPEIMSAFADTAGQAGLADIDNFTRAISKTRCGSIVWLGVDTAHANKHIAELLLHSLYKNMLALGYDHSWVSWELAEGGDSLVSRLISGEAIERRLPCTLYAYHAGR